MGLHTNIDFQGAALIGNAAIIAPNAQKVVYVHHNLPTLSDIESGYLLDYAVSVQAALNSVRTGRGDIIQMLPGHIDTISAADGWSNLGAKTDVTIRGPVTGPPATIIWSAAASSILFDQAGIVIDGSRPGGIVLEFAGDPALTDALTVTAPITISAARCGIHNVRARLSVDADQVCTTGITTTAAADDLHISNSHFFGATAGEVTTGFQIIGCDRLKMINCIWEGATSTATDVGIVRFATTAGLHMELRNNIYINRKALSTCAVTGLASSSGVSWQEHFGYLNTTSLTAWVTSPGIMVWHRPTVTNTAGETGTEVVGTVSA